MAADDTLGEARAQIDALDDQLLALLEQRAQLAKRVGEHKQKEQQEQQGGGACFAVPEREAAILRRLQENSTLLKPHIAAIYREVISACLACEAPVKVAYLGPEGTFTHQAALKMFGSAAVLQPMRGIEATLAAAEKELCDFAVLPFENSAAGTVGEAMDALAHTTLSINGEAVLRIRHNLLAVDSALPLAEVREVHAHPQALEQCRKWLVANVGAAKLHVADSNAAAAEIAARRGAQDEPGVVAIGSAAAGTLYNLATLAASIEDFDNNSTRFLMLGRRRTAPSGADKTSFIMSVRDEPGAMFDVLKPLADNNVNMVKLESRPSRERLWEYFFFVDFIGHRDDAAASAALAEVERRASFMKILGSYPQAVD